MPDSFFMWSRKIYGAEGERAMPYAIQFWIGRLRLHIFRRGDADPDPHDHPWDFWTFPLTSYVEEVVKSDQASRYLIRQAVPAFRVSFREATHTHRVLGRKGDRPKPDDERPGHLLPDEHLVREGTIITIVWRAKTSRKWGFLKARDGRWCWVAGRDYVNGGGKHAPCEPEGDT